MQIQYFCYPLLKHVWLFLRRWKVTKHLIFSSYCLPAVPARWFLRASKDMLAQKLVTLAYTILFLQWTEILPTQCICKEAPLATRLHTICSCLFCHTNFINPPWLVKSVFMLLSTWKSVQEQTQNLRCRCLSVLTASKSLMYRTKLRITLEFISQDILATCLICLNNFNNQEKLSGHMNISPW